MHRILLYIICILLSIAAFACGETHYDSRLTAIAYLLLVLLAVTVFALISAWFSIYNLKKRIGEKEEIMLSLLLDYERLVKLKSEFADQSRKINEINNKTIEAFFSTIKEICSAKNSSEKISATQLAKSGNHYFQRSSIMMISGIASRKLLIPEIKALLPRLKKVDNCLNPICDFSALLVVDFPTIPLPYSAATPMFIQ